MTEDDTESESLIEKYTANGEFVAATPNDNVVSRYKSYPVLNRVGAVAELITGHTSRVVLPFIGYTATYAFSNVLFAALTLGILLGLPGVAGWVVIEYTALTLPSLPADLLDRSEIGSVTAAQTALSMPVAVGLAVTILYGIGVTLRAPWYTVSAKAYVPRGRNVMGTVEHPVNPGWKRITWRVTAALVTIWVLYTLIGTPTPGILLSVVAVGVALVAYAFMIFIVFETLFEPNTVPRLLTGAGILYVTPLTFVEVGVAFLTVLIVLKLCLTTVIAQLSVDRKTRGRNEYYHPKWIATTWGVLVGATVSLLLGGAVIVTAVGYVTAQGATLAFFAYRRRVTVYGKRTPGWTRFSNASKAATIKDLYETRGKSSQTQLFEQMQSDVEERVAEMDTTEFFGGVGLQLPEEAVEDLQYAIEEFKAESEAYRTGEVFDIDDYDTISKQDVERIHEVASELTTDSDMSPVVQQAAGRLEQVTDRVLTDHSA